MKNIELGEPVFSGDIFGKYGLSPKNVININIGCDDKIYFLFENEALKDKSCGKINGYNYSALILDADWYNCEITGENCIDLGIHKDIHYIQPYGENILLMKARCRHGENNAFVINKNSETINEMCFGDAVEDVIVTENGDIITSYFDEGVFGNEDIRKVRGICGLIVWDKNGNVKWHSKRPIMDCYAIDLDESGNLWYYYYDEFRLVMTDMNNYEKEYDPCTEFADGFFISEDMRHIIFRSAKNKNVNFTFAKFGNDKLTDHEELNFCFNGKSLKIKNAVFRGSKAVLCDGEGRVFLYRFGY